MTNQQNQNPGKEERKPGQPQQGGGGQKPGQQQQTQNKPGQQGHEPDRKSEPHQR